MSRRSNLATKDVSEHEVRALEHVLSQKDTPPTEPMMTVEEAMSGKPVYKVASSRDVTRVLFISTDADLLNPVSQTLDGYVEISDLFDEVHILVLRTGIPPKNPVLRASKNVWIYTVSAKSWWNLPSAGMKMVEDQLVFAAGFRPDLIVARDPVESAWLTQKIVKKYPRPAQLHVLDDFTTATFSLRYQNFFRRLVPHFVIGKFKSIRTQTDTMAEKISEEFDIQDVQTLPRLQNYDAFLTEEPPWRLTEKYSDLSIFLLCIGDVTETSAAASVLVAAKDILKNKRIGLIFIGEGAGKNELQRQAKRLGVQSQVIFEKDSAPLLAYVKGAHILIVPDTDSKSEEVVLQGAAAGIPLLIAETEKRKDIFADKYSAYFVDPLNTETITRGISDLLNDVEGRSIMAKNAQSAIEEKFLFDASEYATAYRESIEHVLFHDDVE